LFSEEDPVADAAAARARHVVVYAGPPTSLAA
jgi:hypothetical protein